MACKLRSGLLAGAIPLAWPALTVAAPQTPPPAAPPAIVLIGAAYVAKQLCSCIFVAERPEASCRAEFKPEIDNFTVAVDRAASPAGGKVTATLGPVVAEATYVAQFGCVIVK